MKLTKRIPLTLLASLCLLGSYSTVFAAFTTSGSIDSINPYSIPYSYTPIPGIWDGTPQTYIGYTSGGTLTVDSGSDLHSGYAYIAYASGYTGLATVDGAGSTWTNGTLYVGCSGGGTLSIANGGTVDNDTGYLGYNSGSSGLITVDGAGSTLDRILYIGYSGGGTLSISNGGSVTRSYAWLGYNSGSSGKETVDGTGSTWTNTAGLSIGDFGSGTLSITNGGSVSGGQDCLGRNTGSSGVVTVDGKGSTWTHGPSSSSLYVGYSGSGTLSITNGGTVITGDYGTYLGYNGSSSGMVTVDGAGSTWTNDCGLYVGYWGTGTLSITNGGTVNSSFGYIAFGGGSSMARVDGAGSTWTNSGDLCVGSSGTGTLSITGGGSVAATRVVVCSASLLAVDVGRGSLLNLGSGSGDIFNGGTVRILAGAGVPADNSIQYSPIAAGTWTGDGAYQAVGGTWDATNHTFTASNVQSGTPREAVSIDLASVQRILIADDQTGGTGWTVGASFVAASSTQSVTFTATPVEGTVLDDLIAAAGNNEKVLGAWTFSTTNYTVSSTNPVYLSFDVGSVGNSSDLQLWHYDGSDWTAYTAFDLTYDGIYASFTASSFSGYAMTVPEPSTLILLGIGAIGLSAYGWRRRSENGVRSGERNKPKPKQRPRPSIIHPQTAR